MTITKITYNPDRPAFCYDEFECDECGKRHRWEEDASHCDHKQEPSEVESLRQQLDKAKAEVEKLKNLLRSVAVEYRAGLKRCQICGAWADRGCQLQHYKPCVLHEPSDQQGG